MGRDKVLKKIESLREELNEGSSIIAMIDYEESPMRVFIDRNFEFKNVLFMERST
jgi:selenocysteine-specific translation elongation factor